jgi:hypothetical protein
MGGACRPHGEVIIPAGFVRPTSKLLGSSITQDDASTAEYAASNYGNIINPM